MPNVQLILIDDAIIKLPKRLCCYYETIRIMRIVLSFAL